MKLAVSVVATAGVASNIANMASTPAAALRQLPSLVRAEAKPSGLMRFAQRELHDIGVAL